MSSSDVGRGGTELGRLGGQFDELAQLLGDDGSGPPGPERVVDFAVRAVPHTEHCGLTLIRGDRRPATVGSSDEVTRRVDIIQYETGEGPCLEAAEAEHGDVVMTDDLAVERRWPDFSRRCAAETGVRSMTSLRVFLPGGDRAALNFYAGKPGAFDDLDVAVGSIFAPFAGLAVRSMLQEQQIEHLTTALQSSRQIGTAIGILMARQLLPYEAAFERLVRASQHLNRKLRDIAAEVERTGALPELPARRQGRRA
jgi:GAF domain-containing protein